MNACKGSSSALSLIQFFPSFVFSFEPRYQISVIVLSRHIYNFIGSVCFAFGQCEISRLTFHLNAMIWKTVILEPLQLQVEMCDQLPRHIVQASFFACKFKFIPLHLIYFITSTDENYMNEPLII